MHRSSAFLLALALLLATLALLLGTLAPTEATTTRIGFVAAYGSGGVNNANISPDLTTIGGSEWGSFDVDPLTVFGTTGRYELRILRYHAKCPTNIWNGCTETADQAAAVAAAHPGLTWELGNEPGLGGDQDDGGSGFVTWENATYHTIKTADPTAIVLGPGVINWDGGGYTTVPIGQHIYDGTLWGPITYDGVALHVYPADFCMGGNWQPTALAQVDEATAFSPNVYLTETGDQSAECAYYGYTPPTSATITANFAALKARAESDGVKVALFFKNRPGNETSCPASCTNALLDATGTTKTADGLGWSN